MPRKIEPNETEIKLYRPSNGSEGAMFFEKFCSLCRKEAKRNPCTIIAASMAFDLKDAEYPQEWRYDEKGNPTCTAFSPKSSKPILPHDAITGSALVKALYWCSTCAILRGLCGGRDSRYLSDTPRLLRSARCAGCHGEVGIYHLEIPMTAADFEAVSKRINGQEVNHAA